MVWLRQGYRGRAWPRSRTAPYSAAFQAGGLPPAGIFGQSRFWLRPAAGGVCAAV